MLIKIVAYLDINPDKMILGRSKATGDCPETPDAYIRRVVHERLERIYTAENIAVRTVSIAADME